MQLSTLKRSIAEAKAFIKAAEAVKIKDRDFQGRSCAAFIEYPTKENGAVLRASMDLTRALADLRQNR